MNDTKPINKPLIIISATILMALTVWDHSTPKHFYLPQRQLQIAVIVFILSPLFILWLKALWNEVVPRITGSRTITYLEATGLFALSLLLF